VSTATDHAHDAIRERPVSSTLLLNGAAVPVVEPPTESAETRSVGSPLDFHRRLPGYAPTPLRELPVLARRLGVGRVLVKDEAERLGLPSYKVLGASWAIYRTVVDRFGDPGPWDELAQLADSWRQHGPLTLAAATDGNHGRAVARMARLLGWASVVFVPAGTAQARIDAIAGEGARVEVVDGTYDEAVERSAKEAGERTLVISDTAWPGYDVVPRRVVEGYSTLFAEVDDALGQQQSAPVTHVVAQMGVGALAAAAVRRYRSPAGTRATVLGVEPAHAACVIASVAAGRPVDVPGPHDSIMAGLNCGRPSPVAWPYLQGGLDALLAVPDDRAREAMRLLAAEGVVSGESGAAGLAGLLALRADHEGAAAALGLDGIATVLLVNTEGATDPAAYAEVVGAAPSEARAADEVAGDDRASS
jgi:diaminopropionate ammonia-lyase